MSDLVVGVDIGGTKTAILVTEASAEPDGRVLARTVAPTPVGAPDRAADAIAVLVEAALREAGGGAGDVAAVGVGVPGRVDPERGYVTLAVNLRWHDLPLGPRLHERLGIRTVVENDARAAALGLHRRRVFGDVGSLAVLAIGTGIAAGVVLDGTLHRGALGLAGEIGHVVFDPHGPRCACGNSGCLEAVAAGPAIVARTRAGWAARGDGRADTVTGTEAIFAAAAAGDPVAAEVIDSAGRAIAWGVHLLALAYDTDRIVLSGGVSHAGEAFMAPIRRELDRYREASALAAEVLPLERVQLLPAGADAGAWGAVTIAREWLAGSAADAAGAAATAGRKRPAQQRPARKRPTQPARAQARHGEGLTASADAVLGRLMLAFRGTTVPAWLRERLATAPAAGFTLFRPDNVRTPRQVRALTAALQSAAAKRDGSDGLPILIAADQEGGQLLALGAARGTTGAAPAGAREAETAAAQDWTGFGSPMAIGATGDADLAERVGRAIGLELRAVGVNVNYAPVLDLVDSPDSPALGIRSFGDDPAEVSKLAGAWLRGLQSAGVAGTGKHFPGKGGAGVDTHHELAVVERSREDVAASELVPFRALIEDGLQLVMSGHFANPALTGSKALPATLSRRVMHDLLRGELGFGGVSITDALDMGALPQGAIQAVDVVAALDAGVDLLLSTVDSRARARIEQALVRAAQVELLDADGMAKSRARLDALRRWIASFEQPSLDVVGSAGHRAIARELAARSLTLVRDDDGLLPLRLAPESRMLAVMPAPRDLTPADTSSYVTPALAAALRAHGPRVDEVITAHPPTDAEIGALRQRAGGYDAIVAGTISATPGSPQAELVRALLASGRPVVAVALRTPWDIAAYPEAGTHVCTYSILPESMTALAAALFGRQDADRGRAGGLDAGSEDAHREHAGRHDAGRSAFPGRLPVRARIRRAAA